MSLRYRNVLHSLSKYLPETQAIIDRAVLEGFTLPSGPTLAYINTLIAVMKVDGYWTKRDLILNFAYNDLNCENFSRINWKNPTGNLANYVRLPIVNMLGLSENFTNGIWQKIYSTVTPNASTDPLGGMTATKYVSSAISNRVQMSLGTNLNSNILYNFSCYAKADTSSVFYLSASSNKLLRGVQFDLTLGTIVNEIDGAIGAITSVGSGWYRCSMQMYAMSAVVSVATDTTGSTVFIWGAQLSVGGTLFPYEPILTTNRGRLIYTKEGNIGSIFNAEYVNTNYNPVVNGVNYLLNDASREAVVYQIVADAFIDGNISFSEIMRCSTAQPSRINSGNSSGSFNYFSSGNGYKSIHRDSSTIMTSINLATTNTLAVNSTSLSNGNQTIHRGAFAQGSNLISYYSMGASVITEGQLFRTAYNNYLTNIGLTPIA